MKVFDCFLFNNEFDILKLKLEVLYNHIDFFVIGESNKTFTGKTKPLFFKQNIEQFQKYADKIIHVEITDSPNPLRGEWCWNVEFFQRSALNRGLNKHAIKNDIVIASDVDEIINPEIIPQLKNAQEWLSPEMDLFYYYLNIKANKKGLGPSIGKYGSYNSLEQLRLFVGKNKIIKNGGWHFTFMGGSNMISDKLGAYAESQTNKPELRNEELINYKIANKIDLFNRIDYKYFIIKPSEFPQSIQDFCQIHPQLIYDETKFAKYRSKQYNEMYNQIKTDYTKRNYILKIFKRLYKIYWMYIKTFKK